TLALRAEKEAVFGQGSYEPLTVSGSQAERVFAYIRHYAGDAVLVVVPRLAGLGIDHTTPDMPVPQIDPGFWGDTTIALPVAHGSRAHVDVLAQRDVHVPADGVVNVSELLAVWPVALVALQ
ncbi:MAG: malto-oligosyltrehalose synthase, partial [Burkholderiaceae bacterium]